MPWLVEGERVSTWLDKDSRRHVGVMLGGKRVHRILAKGSSASDAKRVESEIRAALGRKTIHVPGVASMTQIMGLYTKHADTLRSPETAKQHALRIGPWLAGYRAEDARQVASNIVSDMRKAYKPATINRSLGTLSKALSIAYEKGVVNIDYSGHVKRLPENNQRDVTLTLKQIQKIADSASEPVRAAIWIAIYTGCRRGEICTMRADDIGENAITLRAGNTKTLKTRMIPIIAPLRPWLTFIPLRVNYEGLKSGFRRARVAAGMPHVNFHDLRRSCATMMIEKGVDLYVVSKLLGHSSVAVTQKRYAHLQIDRVREELERTFA